MDPDSWDTFLEAYSEIKAENEALIAWAREACQDDGTYEAHGKKLAEILGDED